MLDFIFSINSIKEHATYQSTTKLEKDWRLSDIQWWITIYFVFYAVGHNTEIMSKENVFVLL